MHQITVDGILVDVDRKKVKYLRLTVYPPDGRVRASAPLRTSDEAVRQAVTARLAWIRRHQERIAGQTAPAALEYVTGETHDFRGVGHLLNVIPQNGAGRVIRRDGDEADHAHLRLAPTTDSRPPVIDLYVRRGSDAARRAAVLTEWYRAELKALIPQLLAKWQPVIGVEAAAWGVRSMRTRWGSCNSSAKRVWFNLELVKKSPRLLEYVVVHELVHLLERGHGAGFRALMERFLPGWQRLRDELNHPNLTV